MYVSIYIATHGTSGLTAGGAWEQFEVPENDHQGNSGPDQVSLERQLETKTEWT